MSEDLPEGTTYYKSVDEKGKAVTVYRIIVDNEEESLLCEVYDKWENEWFDYPDVTKAIIGMDDERKYLPIEEEEANKFINPTSKREALSKYVSEKLKKVE